MQRVFWRYNVSLLGVYRALLGVYREDTAGPSKEEDTAGLLKIQCIFIWALCIFIFKRPADEPYVSSKDPLHLLSNVSSKEVFWRYIGLISGSFEDTFAHLSPMYLQKTRWYAGLIQRSLLKIQRALLRIYRVHLCALHRMRRLHFVKRAQHIPKRALHTPKRALIYFQKSPMYVPACPAALAEHSVHTAYMYIQKSPTNPQKSPTNPQKSPTNPQKSPTNPQKSPTNPQKSPIKTSNEPYEPLKGPYICLKRALISSKEPYECTSPQRTKSARTTAAVTYTEKSPRNP